MILAWSIYPTIFICLHLSVCPLFNQQHLFVFKIHIFALFSSLVSFSLAYCLKWHKINQSNLFCNTLIYVLNEQCIVLSCQITWFSCGFNTRLFGAFFDLEWPTSSSNPFHTLVPPPPFFIYLWLNSLSSINMGFFWT